ncbi:BspA family leucine-rich repeat surface protein, partial [Jejuia spongiicola]
DSPSHLYASAGVHTIRIIGTFPRIYFNNTGDKDKIQTVEQWGINPWASMEKAFWGCKNLNITATDAPDLSQVTNMNLMFAESGMNQNINHWNVSTITQMYRLFFNSNFNQPLHLW